MPLVTNGLEPKLGSSWSTRKDWITTMADVLSQITAHLSLEAMQSILDGVALGATHRAEGYDPEVVEGDHGIEKEAHVTASVG